MKRFFHKGPVSWLLRLSAGLIICIVLINSSGSDALKHISSVQPSVPIISVVSLWLCQLLSIIKSRLLLNAKGAHLTFVECARLYIFGMFCNLFLPTAIGGDGVRAIAVGPRVGGITQAASAILVERLTGLAALVTIGAVGLLLRTNATTAETQIPLRIALVLLAVLAGFMSSRVLAYRFEKSTANGSNTGPTRKILGIWSKLHHEIDFYARTEHRKTLAASFALSFVFQAALVGLNIFLARAVGLNAPATAFLWIVPLLSLMSMIPLGIGGLGVREAAAVAVLGNSGNVVAWSLLFQATLWIGSLPGGFFFWDMKDHLRQLKKSPNST